MQLNAGARLSYGRYIIKECIGDGGFGITYVAYDERLDREVVLKEYFPDYMARRDTTVSNDVRTESKYADEMKIGITKFLNEAKTLAHLNHIAAIAAVYDFFEENSTAYIVMEYIKGRNLKSIIKERTQPYSFDEAMTIISPCLYALQKIHETGIIHRDFAPDNILINERGQVKIIDFGASRDFVSAGATMTIMVKHGYAPFEQYSNAVKQGPYTDVYSIAAIIYEMITLIKPMSSTDRILTDMLEKPSKINPGITAYQDEAVMKGLAVVFSSRYQTVDEFREALFGLDANNSQQAVCSERSETGMQSSYVERQGTGMQSSYVERQETGMQSSCVERQEADMHSANILHVTAGRDYEGEATELVANIQNAGGATELVSNFQNAGDATELVSNFQNAGEATELVANTPDVNETWESVAKGYAPAESVGVPYNSKLVKRLYVSCAIIFMSMYSILFCVTYMRLNGVISGNWLPSFLIFTASFLIMLLLVICRIGTAKKVKASRGYSKTLLTTGSMLWGFIIMTAAGLLWVLRGFRISTECVVALILSAVVIVSESLFLMSAVWKYPTDASGQVVSVNMSDDVYRKSKYMAISCLLILPFIACIIINARGSLVETIISLSGNGLNIGTFGLYIRLMALVIGLFMFISYRLSERNNLMTIAGYKLRKEKGISSVLCVLIILYIALNFENFKIYTVLTGAAVIISEVFFLIRYSGVKAEKNQ